MVPLARGTGSEYFEYISEISHVGSFREVLVSMCASAQDGLSEVLGAWRNQGLGYLAAIALERHYRPDEVAEAWGLSVKVIRGIFSSEPGVLKVDRPETRNKRGYRSMRIPESVVVRVHKKLIGASR